MAGLVLGLRLTIRPAIALVMGQRLLIKLQRRLRFRLRLRLRLGGGGQL